MIPPKTSAVYDIPRKVTQALVLLFASVVLVACEAPGPDHKVEVAVQGVLSAGLSQDASQVVIGSIQHGGSLWDVATGERRYNWNRRAGEFTSYRAAELSPNGRVAVTVTDTDLLVWDVVSGKSLNFWRAPAKVLSATLEPGGHYALLGMQNNQAAYFDINQGVAQYEFQHAAEIYGVALSANGRYALTGSDDQSARLWRLEDGALVHTFEHSNQVKTVALSDDGRMAFTTAQREDSVIWDTTSGDALTKLDFRYENFTAARFSTDGKQLLLGTFRGDIYVVDTATGSELYHWKAATRSAWGPGSSGAILALASGGGQKVVAVSSDGMLQTFMP